MDPQEMAAFLQAQREVNKRGTMKFVWETDEMGHQKLQGVRIVSGVIPDLVDPAEVMPVKEAMDLLDRIGVRDREVFRMSGGVVMSPGSGRMRYPALDAFMGVWAKHGMAPEMLAKYGLTGKEVAPMMVRQSWEYGKSAAVDALLRSLEQGDDFMGLPFMDKKTAAVTQFGYQVGEDFVPVTFDDAYQFLADKFGFQTPGGAKFMKRFKELMNLRGLGFMETGTGNTFFKVGLTERKTRAELMEQLSSLPGLTGEALEKEVGRLSAASWDGMSIVKESTVKHIIRKMEDQANAVLKELGKSMDPDSVLQRRRAHALLDEAKELRRQASTGQLSGTARIFGLQVHDLDNNTRATWADAFRKDLAKHVSEGGTEEAFWASKGVKATDEVQGLIKGDVLVMADKIVKKLAGGRNVDVVAGYGAVKHEAGFVGGLARYLSLTPHHAHDVMLDVQSLTSMSFFFNEKDLIETMGRDVQAMLTGPKGLATAKGMAAMADRMERRLLDELQGSVDPDEVRRIEESLGHLQRFREVIATGAIDPRLRGDLMGDLLKSQLESLTSKSIDGHLQPRFRVPDARAAHITMAQHLDDFAMPGAGFLEYDPKMQRWVFDQRTWGDLLKTFGGADLDDTVNALLRMDEDGNLKALLYRQPNAINEFAIMDVDQGSRFVRDMLEAKGADVGVYDTLVGQRTSAMQMVHSAEQRLVALETTINTARKGKYDAAMLQSKFNEAERAMNKLHQSLPSQVAKRQRLIRHYETKQISDVDFASVRIRELNAEIAALQAEFAKARQAAARAAVRLGEAQRMMDDLGNARLMHRGAEQALTAAKSELVTHIKGRRPDFIDVNMADILGRRAYVATRAGGRSRQMVGQWVNVVGQLYGEGMGPQNILVGKDPRYITMPLAKKEISGTTGYRAKALREALEADLDAQAALGTYSNVTMTMGGRMNVVTVAGSATPEQMATVESNLEAVNRLLRRKTGLQYFGSYHLLEHEDAIDMSLRKAAGLEIKLGEGTTIEQLRRIQEIDESKIKWGRVDGKRVATGVTLQLEEVKNMGVRQLINDLVIEREALKSAGRLQDFVGIDTELYATRLAKSGSDDLIDEVIRDLQERFGFKTTLVDLMPDLAEPPPGSVASMHQSFVDSLKHLWGDQVIDEEGVVNKKVKFGPKGGVVGEALKEIGFPKAMIDQPPKFINEEAGQELINRFNQGIKLHKMKAMPLDPSHPLFGLADVKAGKPIWSMVEADVLEELLEHFEEVKPGGERVFGRRAVEALWGLAQVGSKKGSAYNIQSLASVSPGFAHLWNKAHATALLGQVDALGDEALPETLEAMTEAQQIKHGQNLAEAAGEEGPIDKLRLLANEVVGEERIRASIESTRRTSGLRAAQRASAAGDASDQVAAGGSFKGLRDYYKRFASSDLGQIMSTKTGKYAAAGLGIMSAIGVIHAVNKRDRAPEDLAGPPHLPGGSPYTGPMGLGLAFQAVTGSNDEMWGTTYELRAQGGMDPNQLAMQAQFIAGADSVGGSIGDGRSLENPDRMRDRLLQSIR